MRWIFLTALLLLAGCPQGSSQDGKVSPEQNGTGDKGSTTASTANPATLRVYADPVLRAALEALAEGFSTRHAAGWEIEYIERGEMAARLAEETAEQRPDLVLCDKRLCDELISAGSLEMITARTFSGDRLVLVCRSGEDWRPSSFFDTYKLRFTALGYGEDSTVQGFYGDMAFLTSGSRPRMAERLKRYPSGQQIFDALEADEVQLALVFASVAAQRPGVSVLLPIEEELHEDIRFQAAAASGRADKEGVVEALVYLAEDAEAQKILVGYGLQDRKMAIIDNP